MCLWYKLSKAKYGLTVVAPTPISVANEWVSNASPDWTLIETYPLNLFSIKNVFMAPTLNNIGIGNLSSEISLSLRINWVTPCLTAISDSCWILLIATDKLSFFEKVQSIICEFFPKNLINFSNWEFDNIGLFKTYIFSSVKVSKSKIFPRFPKRVFKLITLFSRKESIGGFVTWLKFCLKKWYNGLYLSDKTARGVSSPIEPVASFASSAIGCRINSKSSKLIPKVNCLRLNSSPSKLFFSFDTVNFSSKSIIWELKCLNSLDKWSLMSLFEKTLPFSIFTPMISPGPSLPFDTILFSSISIIPVSEPAKSNLSVVIAYLNGLKPFLSLAAITHSLSVAAIAAGPSHGSIVLFKKLNNCWWFFGKVLFFFDHASGTSINLANGAGFPDLFNNSKTLSSAAESETPFCITGFKFSTSSKSGLVISCSCTRIQFLFPLYVLISPLWAIALKGWAKLQLGAVFVENLWWKIAYLDSNLLSFKSK